MPPDLITTYTDIAGLDTLILGGGLPFLSPWVEFAIDGSTLAPGQTLPIAWDVGGAGRVRWTSVDLEIALVTGGDVEHIWDRRGVAWPPVRVGVEDTDGIWPPIGMVADTAVPSAVGRATLFSGLGTKTLRLSVTGHGPDGSSTALSADLDVLVGAPAGVVTARITSPRQAAWNSGYTLHAHLQNDAFAAVTFDVSASGSDGSSFPAVSLRLAARSSADQDIAGPIVQTWPWVDKPQYHVESSQLRKTFTYTPVVTNIVDEYGNAYPDQAEAGSAVVVSVPESKVHDANLSEANFWLSAGFAVGGAVSGAFASIPVVTAIFAPLAAGAAVEAIYYGGVAAMYAQSADDPPAPDPNYGVVVEVPVPVATPENDTMPGTSRLAAALHRIARCQLAASCTTSRYLGAVRAKDGAVAQLHADRLTALAAAVTTELSAAHLAAADAAAEIAGDQTLTPDSVSAALKTLAAKGVPAAVTKALVAQLGPGWGQALASSLADPKFAATVPPLTDVIVALPYLAEQAARTNLVTLTSVATPQSCGC